MWNWTNPWWICLHLFWFRQVQDWAWSRGWVLKKKPHQVKSNHEIFLGYVSGENIIINGYVKNFSKVTIRHCKIVLLETIQYLSRGKLIQTEKRELAQIKFPKIRPNSRDEFVNKKLYVPPLPPTNIRNSNIIRLNYDVYVSWAFYWTGYQSSTKRFLLNASLENIFKVFLSPKHQKYFRELIRNLWYHIFHLVTLIWGISPQVASFRFDKKPLLYVISVNHRAEIDGKSDKTSTADSACDISIPIHQWRLNKLARLCA